MTTAVTVPPAPLTTVPLPEDLEKTATYLATEYGVAMEKIGAAIAELYAQCDHLNEIFEPTKTTHRTFRLKVETGSNFRTAAETLTQVNDAHKRVAWEVLLNGLGIKNFMSIADRTQFEKQLESGELPDISAQAIVDIIAGMAGQAQSFSQKAIREVFDRMRPRSMRYKSVDRQLIGRKVILSWVVEPRYNGKSFQPTYRAAQELTAIDGVFHLLDGKGLMREPGGPLAQAIINSPDGRGETAYFRFRCYRNHNLHLYMKRLDLVKELNFRAAGERELGLDATEEEETTS